MKNKKFKKTILTILIAQSLLTASSMALAAPLVLSQTPLFLSVNTPPNVMIMYGNSNSMDADATGAAVGSASTSGKSEISRKAVKDIVTAYKDKINLGLMGYQQQNTVAKDLYNSPYDVSFDPLNYNPTYTGPRESSTDKKYRTPNLTDIGKFIYYNVASPSYLDSGYSSSNALNANFFCYTADNKSKAFSNGEVIFNNNISDPQSGTWLPYNCFNSKSGIKNSGPASNFSTANGYTNNSVALTGTLFPTDSDLAKGVTNFGNQITGNYVSKTWFSNKPTLGGYVHTPVSLLNTIQSTQVNTKLGTSQFVINAPIDKTQPLQNAGLSPIAGSVLTAGKYFKGTLNSSVEGGTLPAPPSSCGKDFLIMLTDGLPSVLSSGAISYDPADLLTDLKNTVSQVKTTQALTTYVVGFSLPFGVNPSQLNSIAAAGGSGSSYYADDSTTLNTALNNVFSDVIARTGASSSVALNSGYVSSDNKVYQARFNSLDWSGDLLSIPLDSNGNLPVDLISNTTWKASVTTGSKAHTMRTILTIKENTGKGIPFRWPANIATPTLNEMDISQTTPLNKDPSGVLPDNLGSIRLNFLRGDRTQEGTTFRKRSTVLGDIINSAPILVKSPEATKTSASYLAFKQSQINRPAVIYVGANDGMMHGFKASNGEEILAYVPKSVFKNLNQLSSKSYTHRYFVDGSPNVGDVFYNGNWQSVLVGGMGAGGRGIYSLDITNPQNFSEANAANIVKFEFNESNDLDVGFISGAPSIVQLNNGRTAALFGNGYNSTGTGQSSLFLVDIETGVLIKKISTGVGSTLTPNALANPTPVDSDGNGTIDFVYAGDLTGKMWKFDLSSDNISQWNVAYNKNPLFDTGKPITQQADVTPHSLGGYMVSFGTGKFIEVSDNINIDSNSFFGLWDNESNVINNLSDLQAQTVTSQTPTSRQVSSTAVNYPTKRGWYLTLPSSGERSVTDPIIKGGKVIFTTLVPSSAQCSFGGTSWLMEVDYLNGTQSKTPSFDTNKDGVISSTDTPTSGIALLGIASAPTILQGLGDKNRPLQKIFTNESTGNISSILNQGSKLTSRRTSWKEIINK